jgi:pimeloyl-ACP methyl ester carboxylesterase
MIQVEPDVKLEVLDWGGTGRPLVLLSGLGDTAHVFDKFQNSQANTTSTGSPGAVSERPASLIP